MRTVHYSILFHLQVKFKGHLSYKIYMPLKPTKFGIKIWARCNDNGYLQQFEIYIGNKETKVFPNGLYFDIVDQLTKELWGKNHHVFFDNLYTSVHLIDSFEKAWHTCSRHSPCK